MLVVRRARWVVRRVDSVFVRDVRAAERSWGRRRVACSCSMVALVGRSETDSRGAWGGGDAMVQRRSATRFSWVDSAAEMAGREARKWAVSLERISRSEVGTWPRSWAVTISMTAWRSGGRVGAFEGRSERVVMRM